MPKEELKKLYKAKPELIEEHKRLVNVLRSGSKKNQLKEASKQLKELKEMVNKEENKNIEKKDRCWEGYEPTPGKKPYEKGSCQPVKKIEHALNKQDVVSFEKKQKSKRSWKIKIKGKEGYHDVKDVKDMGPQKHNSYILHDNSIVSHDDVEDLDVSGEKNSPNKAESLKSGDSLRYIPDERHSSGAPHGGKVKVYLENNDKTKHIATANHLGGATYKLDVHDKKYDNNPDRVAIVDGVVSNHKALSQSNKFKNPAEGSSLSAVKHIK